MWNVIDWLGTILIWPAIALNLWQFRKGRKKYKELLEYQNEVKHMERMAAQAKNNYMS